MKQFTFKKIANIRFVFAIYKISDYVSCIYVRTYMQYIDILAFLEYHIPSSMSLKRKRFRITHKRVISFL